MDTREYRFVLQRKLVEAKNSEVEIKHLHSIMEKKEFPVCFPEGLIA